jgi:hypothetical protein
VIDSQVRSQREENNSNHTGCRKRQDYSNLESKGRAAAVIERTSAQGFMLANLGMSNDSKKSARRFHFAEHGVNGEQTARLTTTPTSAAV